MPALRALCLFLAIISLAGYSSAAGRPPLPLTQSIQAELAQLLRAPKAGEPVCLLQEPVNALAWLQEFYSRRSFAPVWMQDSGLAPAGRNFLRLLENAGSEGLRPNDYHLQRLLALAGREQDWQRPPGPEAESRAASLEILLSDAFFSFGTHLAVGRINLKIRDGGIFDPRQDLRLEELLTQALASGRVLESLQTWSVRNDLYAGLKQALEKYRGLVAGQNWPDIPEGTALEPGTLDPVRVPLVRTKLLALGDLAAQSAPGGAVLDADLQAALRRYQSRHGLAPDGRLTLETIRQLNRPLEDTVRQLEINLERCRWLPRDLGARYIQVNIPGFQLLAQENGRTVLRMKVVVGEQVHDTPVFASRLSFLVLNPSWIIPTKIILEEKLPQIQQDPEFFSRNHITVLEGWDPDIRIVDPQEIDWRRMRQEDYYTLYRFRQEPGPWNALGRMKFVMPNPYDVYLHDTPSRGLFRENVRSFSHGCIRLEKPLALAYYLLGDSPRVRRRLLKALASRREQRVDLPAPVPIYISYMTVFPGEGQALYFYPDIYGHDQELAAVWDRPALNPCASGPAF